MSTLTQTQVASMLSLQHTLNSVVNPNWIAANYPWGRAILVEAVEALDHIGWKWWKGAPPWSATQIKLELIDIWHFGLSMILQESAGDQTLASKTLSTYLEATELQGPDMTAGLSLQDLFQLIAGTGAQHQFNGAAFIGAMQNLGLSWSELYTTYVAKNVLNLFRQANGYKDGTYIKMWNGKEDNEVLEFIMKGNEQAAPHDLMYALDEAYKDVVPPFVQPA